MYWTLWSDDPPRCLFPHTEDETIAVESMCGERGRHSDPDETEWTLNTLTSTHPSLAAAMKDQNVCFECRVAVVEEHNLPEGYVHG